MTGVTEGTPHRLGATWDGRGVNFGLFSAHATQVELCLFDPTGRRETDRVPLPGRTDDIWHGHVDGVRPGQLYGYRVSGPYRPEAGHRFNANKLLVDPYARLLSGPVRYGDAIYGYRRGGARADLGFDRRDSASAVPKAVVVDPAHDWGADIRPGRPWSETVIYEAHVRGLTRLHPEIPEPVRGTYAALGHPAVVEHLQRLGITALELLPIHEIADEPSVHGRGLANYWGYSTLGYFAPAARYLGEPGIAGFRQAIRALHDGGIEVILDVVYNHTAEGEEDGPTLSFRGIDNASYYKARPDDPRRTWDTTGCGNTLDLSHPRVMQLVLDSLRHWAEEYHVDGFRFDLATSLGRDPTAYSARAAVFQAIAQDPVLRRLKMIAEPWDLGPEGYRVGGFPTGWSEWNDQFRDTNRAFWRGDPDRLPRIVQGLCGSREIFEASGRGPAASINFVTAHDGFTLRDLVSYDAKHNEQNGEGNRDGTDNNLSSNHGVEGESSDPAVVAARARTTRNMLATLLLAQGVPMLLAGDEVGRSQGGNNNAYCQDNETSWIDWSAGLATDPDLPDFVANLLGIRCRFAALRRRDFFTGEPDAATGLRDVYWLDQDARRMDWPDWADPERRTIGMQIGNDAPDGLRLMILLNASLAPIPFRLDPELPVAGWQPVFATTEPKGLFSGGAKVLPKTGTFPLAPRSIVLFQHQS